MKLVKAMCFILIIASGFAIGAAAVDMPNVISLPLSFIVGIGATLYAVSRWEMF